MLKQSAVVFATLALAASFALAQDEPPLKALQLEDTHKLMVDSGGQAKVSMNPATGVARFVRLEPGSLRLGIPLKAAGPARARAFFDRYGGVFGITEAGGELIGVRSVRDAFGGEHASFIQTYGGVPVFGAQLKAHFDGRGELYAANGTFVPGIKIDTEPRLGSDQAARIAVGVVAAQNDDVYRGPRDWTGPKDPMTKAGDALSAVASNLYVFRAGLVQGVAGPDHLVYEVEVVNPAGSIREFVYVDAHSGRVVDQITGVHEILDREVSEGTLANVIWDESNGDPDPIPAGWAGGTPQQIIDWQDEIDGAKETYYYFFSIAGRDSYDGAGATMRTVNNDPTINCPNANWNGTSTNYCTGVTADDVVAHEWEHAYTEFTNNLIYQWQSGALNEAYSDIVGEAIDILNGRGTDAPGGLRSDGGCSIYNNGAPDDSYRWLLGEDATAFGTAIRDMWTPTCEGDPGKVTDAEYFCGTGDNGGVHSNSGVPNHAFALMVDGGTYNGFTITGIGLTKAAHIHWGSQLLLTINSNFVDHADALETACSNLTGVNLPAISISGPSPGPSGEIITAADCDEVADAIDAVELRTPPTQCDFQPLLDPDAPPLCEGLGSVQTVAFEDFEGGALPAGWTASTHDVVNPATFSTPDWAVVSGLPAGANGTYAAFVADLITGDCVNDVEAGALALDSPSIVLPVGEVPKLAFDHWVATEAGWDGGNVKISVNAGPFVLVPPSAYSFNAYNGALNGPPNDNPLAGESAFTGSNGGEVSGSWGQSQVELFGLALPGDTVQLRYDFGVDGCNGLIGWYVDDVHVYTCSDEELPECGDGVVDPGEECDDGNSDNGDGCSSECDVEDGWVCENPQSSGGENVVADGSFEAGPGGGFWLEFSTNFGTPICDVGTCGTGTGTGPSDGNFWVWFGGIAAYEAGIMRQDVTIPATATNLTFDLEQIVCDSGNDYAALFIDGNLEWFTLGSSPLCGTLGYTPQTVNVLGYADGGTHQLQFQSESFAANGGASNFFIDNVVLSDNVVEPGGASICTFVITDLACDGSLVEFTLGVPGSWTVIDNEGGGVVWTDIASSGLGANYTGGDGDAASANSDAFPFVEYDTELISNAFSLEDAASASLDYLANYLNIGPDFLDVDISTDGGGSWTNLLSWNENHGVPFGLPGEAVSLDLAAYLGESDVQVRWHYYNPNFGDWDWYAQVDNVALTCNLKPDCDGATASPDTLWSPNHQFEEITVDVTDPDGDPVTVTVDSIFQDEPVLDEGTGNTCPDGQGVGTSTAEVRAERDGNANGRVYHIGFTADDGRGGTCTGEVQVGVPHDQSGTPPVDDGALHDSTGC